MLHIRNSMTGSKEKFVPINYPDVLIYACGVTTYDLCHIGHATQALAFDLIVNYLRFIGYRVKYVRNFTDVDDKIINAAKEQKIAPIDLSAKMIDSACKNYQSLNISSPDHEPKVSEMIEEIIKFIQKLIEKKLAYSTDQGHVYFNVDGFSDYGKLSNRSLDQSLNLTRDTVSEGKKHSHDFALWKAVTDGSISWESPWSSGRPGWHIECSTMIAQTLGKSIDIHGGGRDLLFPHHENEIAQSQGCFDQQFVKYWMHSGLITVDGQKMSKSLGNQITIDQFLLHHPAELLRFYCYSHHYRSDIDFNHRQLKKLEKKLLYYYCSLKIINQIISSHLLSEKLNHQDYQLESSQQSNNHSFDVYFDYQSMKQSIYSGLNDDFNSPLVLSQLGKYFTKARSLIEKIENCSNLSQSPESSQHIFIQLHIFKRYLKDISEIFKLLADDPDNFIHQLKQKFLVKIGLTNQDLLTQINLRNHARSIKNYSLADQIRKELLSKGILLCDQDNFTEWTINHD